MESGRGGGGGRVEVGWRVDSTAGCMLILETQRRQYEGHNTPLGYHTDQGP